MGRPKSTRAKKSRTSDIKRTAFHAARSDDADLLLTLLQSGLPVNLSDAKGDTLLLLAAYGGRDQAVRLLLEFGADANQPNERGQTPLAGAASRGHTEVAKLLIGAGADIEKENGLGATPLLCARIFGWEETARVIEEAGARADHAMRMGILPKGASVLGRFVVRPLLAMFSRRK